MCAFAYAADNVCSGATEVTDPSGGSAFNHGITIGKKGTGSGTPITGDIISASVEYHHKHHRQSELHSRGGVPAYRREWW